jgi:hypothetical protein
MNKRAQRQQAGPLGSISRPLAALILQPAIDILDTQMAEVARWGDDDPGVRAVQYHLARLQKAVRRLSNRRR